MILLYTFLLLGLGVAHYLMGRRVATLERKHTRATRETEQLAKGNQWKEGNTNRMDAFAAARRQFRLGQLVEKCDRLEVKHDRWLQRWEKLGRGIAALRAWKGRKLPYTFGALDFSGALILIDRFGLHPYLDGQRLLQLVQEWWHN